MTVTATRSHDTSKVYPFCRALPNPTQGRDIEACSIFILSEQTHTSTHPPHTHPYLLTHPPSPIPSPSPSPSPSHEDVSRLARCTGPRHYALNLTMLWPYVIAYLQHHIHMCVLSVPMSGPYVVADLHM